MFRSNLRAKVEAKVVMCFYMESSLWSEDTYPEFVRMMTMSPILVVNDISMFFSIDADVQSVILRMVILVNSTSIPK